MFRNNKFNEWQAGEETVKKQKQAFLVKLERNEGGYPIVAILRSPPRTVSSHKETCGQPFVEPTTLLQSESIVQSLRYVGDMPNIMLLSDFSSIESHQVGVEQGYYQYCSEVQCGAVRNVSNVKGVF